MIYTSPLPDIQLPKGLNYARFMLKVIDNHASSGKYALVDPNEPGRSVLYSDLRGNVEKLAVSLKVNLNVTEGDVIMLAMANSCEFVQLCLACALINATVTPINYTSNAREMSYQITDATVAHILTDMATLPTIEDAVKLSDKVNVKMRNTSSLALVLAKAVNSSYKSLSIILCDTTTTIPTTASSKVRTLRSLVVDSLHQHELNPGTHKLAHLPYSSGTTGLPKGVMLSHDCLCKNITIAHSTVDHHIYKLLSPPGHPETDVMFLPLYHMFGFCIMMINLYAGVSTVIMHRWTPAQYFELIQKFKPTFLTVVPPVALRMIKDPIVDKYDLSSVQILMSSAAPMAAATEIALGKKHQSIKHVVQGFGMTELTAFAATGGLDGKQGNCGQLCPNVKMKIVDPSTHEDCEPGVPGEICIHTPSVMIGYYKRPKATNEVFDRDGYLLSGDIGYIDEKGYLYITDRIKELIKVKGNQVAPAELEAVLTGHPKVEDCGVIGVASEDGEEHPLAVVVKAGHVTEGELVKYVEGRVSRHKRLTAGVIFTDSIPKSPSGKILRRLIREKFLAAGRAKI